MSLFSRHVGLNTVELVSYCTFHCDNHKSDYPRISNASIEHSDTSRCQRCCYNPCVRRMDSAVVSTFVLVLAPNKVKLVIAKWVPSEVGREEVVANKVQPVTVACTMVPSLDVVVVLGTRGGRLLQTGAASLLVQFSRQPQLAMGALGFSSVQHD